MARTVLQDISEVVAVTRHLVRSVYSFIARCVYDREDWKSVCEYLFIPFLNGGINERQIYRLQ